MAQQNDRRLLVLLLALLGVATTTAARERVLSSVFGDNMVLQASPNSAVLFGSVAVPYAKVPIYLDGVLAAQATADASGKWVARLAPVKASNVRHQLQAGSQVLSNVLFGDVILCAGQHMLGAEQASVGTTYEHSNVRALLVTERRLAANNEQLRWEPVGFGADDACLAMGVRAAEQSGHPVGLVQAVYDAPLASWVPLSDKMMIADDIECSACEYDMAAWDAVLRHVAPMRVGSFVWVGDDSREDRARCVASKCVHSQLALGVRDAFATNNARLRTLRDDPFVVVGHRGMPSACPENTIVSQEVARRGGTVWIEDDTQPSKDGVPFVLHDSTVDRTTNGKGEIRKLTASELKKLDAGSWFHPSYAGTRLPTLEEQLSDLSTRGGNLLLEIKGAHTYAEVQRIIDLIRKTNMTERVFIQSFDRPSLQYSYQIAPSIPIALLTSVEADPASTCKALHLSGYNPDYGSLIKRPEVVKQLHDIGVSVFVWTPDTPAEWATLKKLGVDGVITNKATQLQGWVSAINQQAASVVDDVQRVTESTELPIVIVDDTAAANTARARNVVAVPRGTDLAAVIRGFGLW